MAKAKLKTKRTKQPAPTELQPDPNNTNRGTERGLGMLETSIRKHGAGRPGLCDKRGTMIAGSKTLDRMRDLGIKVKVVEVAADEWLVAKRPDLDMRKADAQELGIADNRIAEVDLDIDPAMLAALIESGVDVTDMWFENELALLLSKDIPFDPEAEYQGMPEYSQEDKKPFKQLIVSFESQEDLDVFAETIGQPKITPKTKSVWFPEHKQRKLKHLQYIGTGVSEDAESDE